MRKDFFVYNLLKFFFIGLAVIALLVSYSYIRGRATTGASFNLPTDFCKENLDSTVDIQNFAATLPSGSTLVFPSGKTCMIAQTVLLPGGVTYDLNGATLARNDEPEYDKARPLVKFDGVSDVTITNGTIRGALVRGSEPKYDPLRPKYHGIQTSGAQNIVISNMTIKDIHGDCVDIDGNQTIGPSKNITVQNVSCSGSGRQGISTGHVDGVLLDNVDFDFVARTAVDLEPTPGKGSHNVTIQNSTFRWIGNFAFAMAAASPNLTNIVVQNNTQVGCAAQIAQSNCFAPFGYIGNKYMRGPITVKDNQVKGKIRILHMSGDVTGNVMTANPFNETCLVLKLDSPNLSVHDNTPLPGVNEVCVFDASDFPGAGTGTPAPTSQPTQQPTQQPTLNPTSSTTPSPTGGQTTYDVTSPRLIILSPAYNSQVSGTIELAVRALDNKGISKVEFYLDGKLIGTGVVSGSRYVYSWNSISTANGEHTITTTAYDTSNNSVTVNVKVIVVN